MTVDGVDAIAQGRVWSGQQAFEAGLVDELGGLYTAARRVKSTLGLDPEEDDVLLVPWPKQTSLTQQIVEALSSVSVRAAQPVFEWPAPLASLAEAARGLPNGSPALIPPMMIEIR